MEYPWFLRGPLVLVWLAAFSVAGYYAWDIRMYAIREYGLVIHEFDPWFNYRATEYLGQHGIWEFFHWYDYKVWYPIGRPVGTTIYPGMQLSSVAIWRVLNDIVGHTISLNDVCCYVPTWFGVSATTFLGLLAAECANSWIAGWAAASIMAIVPAHIMRSVGGGYDNESVALTALTGTFYCWCRALRDDPKASDPRAATRDSYIWGTLTGFAYIYMAAAWGGFTFVLNMIALHAAVLTLLGQYSSKLHRAYTLFYVIGTLGAMQVPVIGWTPVRSLEQLGALASFLCLQAIEYAVCRAREKDKNSFKVLFMELLRYGIILAVVVGAAVAILFPMGYFGPLGARIRGLFVKHTRTGNPLVDSVAEHQPANEQAYKQYLHHIYHIAPVGFAFLAARVILYKLFASGYRHARGVDAPSFLVLYGATAYYFCTKMSRLIILLGPVASALAGAACGIAGDELLLYAFDAILGRTAELLGLKVAKPVEVAAEMETSQSSATSAKATANSESSGKRKSGKKAKNGKKNESDATVKHNVSQDNTKSTGLIATVRRLKKKTLKVYDSSPIAVLRIALAVYLLQRFKAVKSVKEFYDYSHSMAKQMSHPQLMFKGRLQDGSEVLVDDYRECYWWLRDKTPEDSRVMAWWDYGYQITGIGNRTTIADGNTWNHEHIATLGRILSANEKRAHRIARHLADYVLVWAGGGGDDLAKSPHMARIGNSVFHDICDEPTCSEFGFEHGGKPTPMMAKSLLYKMTQYGYRQGVQLDSNRFSHAFSSKYGKCRIFKVEKVSQESKRWVADPANRVCEHEGSWLCRGQYPPALDSLIAKRKNFKQLEDFNTKSDDIDRKYQEEYHKRLGGKHPLEKGGDAKNKQSKAASVTYIGCYGSETDLPKDKVYGGAGTGASISAAVSFAQRKNKKFLAIARDDTMGHVFAFNSKPKSSSVKINDAGCDRECSDADEFKCGCADGGCDSAGVDAVEGEEHKRRWVVYSVPEKAAEKSTKKKKKTKKRAEEDL